MKQAAIGDTVRVHYTGTLEDGTEFDTSAQRGPLEVTLGGGQVIDGFERAIVGMAEGETRTVTITPDDAYGQRNEELIHIVERSQIPAEIELQVGAELQATDDAGNHTRLMVVGLSAENVTLDGNHPLAGAALTFQLQLTEFVG